MARNANADRDKATALVADLRDDRAQLRAALRALPAPAARNPAQRRDALVLRTCADLVAWALISAGVAGDDDRAQTEP
jgi:hypothetical protein